MTLSYLLFPEALQPEIIPGLPFRWYGLMYLVAFMVTYLLVLRGSRRDAILAEERQHLSSLLFWTIFAMLVGARLVSVFVYDPSLEVLRRPWIIVWPFDEGMNFVGLQGMSFHGGLVGAALGFLIYSRARRLSTLQWADLLAMSVPLGYTFGRIGNFINQELYGRITAAPWGVLFPEARAVPASHPAASALAGAVGISVEDAGQMLNLPRHPSQLYEAFLEGVLLWLLLRFLLMPRRPFPGAVTAGFFAGYGFFRFIAEYFRMPDPGIGFVWRLAGVDHPIWLTGSPLSISTGQIFSLVMILVGVACFFMFRAIARRRPKVEVLDL